NSVKKLDVMVLTLTPLTMHCLLLTIENRPAPTAEQPQDARVPGICYTHSMPRKSKANSVAVGLVQMSCDPQPAANLKKAIAGIGEAAKKGAQIVCLQELFRSQYFCQTEDIEL